MSNKNRMLIILVVDICIIWIAIGISYLFRFNGNVPPIYEKQMLEFACLTTVICGSSLAYFRMYRRMWQYASIGEIIELAKAILIGIIISYGATYALNGERVPLSITSRTLELMLLFMGGSRFLWRLIRVNRTKKTALTNNVLIVGAGDCGALIAKEFMTSNSFMGNRIIGFIDDDPHKRNMQVVGLPVLGTRLNIEEIAAKHQIHDIVIAMPSVKRVHITEIINICKLTGAKVKIIPSINDFIRGRVAVKSLRNVEVEDLLGREPVITDLEGIANYVSDKVVLVTGAGGSIGSELCRQISAFKPSSLLLLGHGENSIYLIEMELRSKFPNVHLETVIADIQDRGRLESVFHKFRPQVVFHAAAHKHVPLMERNPSEAVKNNVFGTRNVADCADKYKAERFVMISSDKAVNPSSIMGATKRIAEMYIQSINTISETQFVAVRFGNVLGSRGSVIPRFKEQIAAGGPVTVTHPDMVRYFMTIPEAVQLVIQAGSFAKGGEIFVLDMGKPVRILDLAQDLIRLSGYEPNVDIEIKFSGMREGEKLFEELLTDEEAVSSTQHERIYIGKPTQINRVELELQFKRIEKVIGENQNSIKDVIEHLVPFYSHVS
ncbi:nucleoside-diphosphate sugar epimerase/dehydratase [Bacillus sp. FJAT-26390]|uniref:polysaccharide biosynthesis protein n=1 Tax=Bacillus sp. FJAT-26390 TaxID=1743142 RepID=UPI000807BC9B|nr:nucleoside-diphosphate sugar epimerase/dehydratase [Bacillus sp. FJAT-26390]OBZ11234.1 polysaccharide biosynthesis protein [Bacillus sp. FJAT-26390]